MTHRPVILMTTSNIHSTLLEPITGDTEIVYSDTMTANAVMKAGGLPLYMPSTNTATANELALYLNLADAVLITGADSNVNPLYYDEAPIPTSYATRIDDERDKVDIALVQLAYKRRLPMLGICKGMQIINVALGGTLYQDITTQLPHASQHNIAKSHRANLTHIIRPATGSLAEDIFGKGKAYVNAGHQQAVKELASCLKPTATTEDGVIEMYEGREHPFTVGVQFHPELRAYDPPFLSLFEHFVKISAKETRNER